MIEVFNLHPRLVPRAWLLAPPAPVDGFNGCWVTVRKDLVQLKLGKVPAVVTDPLLESRVGHTGHLMNFVEAISSGFSKYVQFGGRACRSEYWYWTLFSIIASIVANIIDATIDSGMVSHCRVRSVLAGSRGMRAPPSRHRSNVLVDPAGIHLYRHVRPDLLGLPAWHGRPQSLRRRSALKSGRTPSQSQFSAAPATAQ